MSSQGTEPTGPTDDYESSQGWRGWQLAAAGVALLTVVAVVVLELWGHPPVWLHGIRRLVVDTLHWVRVHWATSGALGVVATLLLYVL